MTAETPREKYLREQKEKETNAAELLGWPGTFHDMRPEGLTTAGHGDPALQVTGGFPGRDKNHFGEDVSHSPIDHVPGMPERPKMRAKSTVEYATKIHLLNGGGVIYLKSLDEPHVVRVSNGVRVAAGEWINGHVNMLKAEAIAGVSTVRQKYKEDPANYEPVHIDYWFVNETVAAEHGAAPFHTEGEQ